MSSTRNTREWLLAVVDDVGADVHGALEAEGGIRAVDVVVYGLWERDYVHAGVGEELGALLRAVAAHHDQAVEIEAVIGVEHGGHEVVALFVYDGLARDITLPGRAQDCAALGEDAGEVLLLHVLVVALYEALVTVVHAEYLDIIDVLEERLAHAAYRRVEPLAVSARGHQAHSGISFHEVTSVIIMRTYLTYQTYHTVSRRACQPKNSPPDPAREQIFRKFLPS